MARIVNLAIGIMAVAIGGAILSYLIPILFQPDVLKAVLITLPSKHAGLSPAAKIGLFGGIVVFSFVLMGWGVYTLFRFREKKWAFRNGLIVVQVILGVIMLEGAFRAGEALEVGPFKNATYFVNPVCGDAYYRIIHKRAGEVRTSNYDPLLGWSLIHPSGKAETGLSDKTDSRAYVWFFGDSFTQGVVGSNNSVPAIYEELRPDLKALNFGVGGYGLDQILLRYRRESPNIPPGASVFVGVLTTDIDRAVLKYFSSYKPVFQQTEKGTWQLVPPPGLESIPKLYEEAPAPIRSYAGAAINTFFELVTTGFDRSEAKCDQEDKKEVNRFLIDTIVKHALERGHHLRWILFVHFSEFYKPYNWRYDFLRKSFEARGQEYLNTKIVLQSASDAAGILPESFYIPNDGHLNEKGNRAVAEALVEFATTER